jgi:hypothetical protein
MRIDLDGVPLADANGRVTCLFRYRTIDGLVLRLPESVDVTVPWADVAEASLDLGSGHMRIRFHGGASRTAPFLIGIEQLTGEWTDRALLRGVPS